MSNKPADVDWIIKAMVAVAGADGRLNAREVGCIQKAYQDKTGRAVDVSGVALAVQAYATTHNVLAELSLAAGSMSGELKEEISRAAYRMLLADECVAGQERGRLKEIAAALRISETHLGSIVENAAPNPGEEGS